RPAARRHPGPAGRPATRHPAAVLGGGSRRRTRPRPDRSRSRCGRSRSKSGSGMTVSLDTSAELAALATAIGLLDASGELDPGWFAEPLTRLEGAVRTPEQRAALIRFFDLALPPVPEPGRPAAEKW